MKLNLLSAMVDPVPIDTLGEPDIKELQLALAILGYPVGAIDGLIGPKTRTAWAEFKTDVFEGKPDWIGPGSVKALNEKLERLAVDGHELSTREDTIEAIRSECVAQGIGSPEQVAYIVATVEWETAKTFQPVREAFWLSESWRKKNLRYYPYYGRGYVQLTWKNNYERYSELLSVDMVAQPDLALDASSALFILCHGFKTGIFTGHKITEYIHGSAADFANARRCINGTDHASDIARLADHYLLQFSG